MKIYNINFNNLAHQLLPTFLRKRGITALLDSILYPVKKIHGEFMKYRNDNIYKLGINSQVCYLEKSLNEKEEFRLKMKEGERIFIKDDEIYDQTYIFTDKEEKPLYIYNPSENINRVFIYTENDILGNNDKYDFLVKIPESLVNNESQIRSVVNTFKLPSKKFNVTIQE